MNEINIYYGKFDIELSIYVISYHYHAASPESFDCPGEPEWVEVEEIDVQIVDSSADDDDLELIVELDRIRHAIVSGDVAADIIENDVDDFYEKVDAEYESCNSPW